MKIAVLQAVLVFSAILTANQVQAQSLVVNASRFNCPKSAVWLSPDDLMKQVVGRSPVISPMMEPLNLHGTVDAEVCVDANGKVASIRIVNGDAMAMGAVVDSLKNWRFAPYIWHNRARFVHGAISIPFDFRVQTPGAQ